MSEWTEATLKRMGRADAAGLHRMAGFLGTLFDGLPARLERPAGAWLVALGPGHLVNKVAGLGLDGPVPEAGIEQAERAFAEAGVAPGIELWPGADPGLRVMLEARGYRASLTLSVLAAALEEGPEPAGTPGVDVLPVDASLEDLYERTVSLGFLNLDDGEPALRERVFARGAARSPHAGAWLATIGGAPAGGGAMSADDGIASLFGASTLPRFRRRGVQRALLEARWHAARAAGAEFAFLKTAVASGSERNATRAGFRKVGETVLWTRGS